MADLHLTFGDASDVVALEQQLADGIGAVSKQPVKVVILPWTGNGHVAAILSIQELEFVAPVYAVVSADDICQMADEIRRRRRAGEGPFERSDPFQSIPDRAGLGT